jgi:hypothetical protein
MITVGAQSCFASSSLRLNPGKNFPQRPDPIPAPKALPEEACSMLPPIR